MVDLGVQLIAHAFDDFERFHALRSAIGDHSPAVTVDVTNVQPALSNQVRDLSKTLKMAARFRCAQVKGDVSPLRVRLSDYVAGSLRSERVIFRQES